MSPPRIPHPADRSLIAFKSGKLEAGKAAAINKHLKGCHECRRRLAKLSAASSGRHCETPSRAAASGDASLGVTASGQARLGDEGIRPLPTNSSRFPPCSSAVEKIEAAAAPQQFRPWQKVVVAAVAATAVGAFLLGLLVAWMFGAFQSKNKTVATAVENPGLPAQPAPRRMKHRSGPPCRPSGAEVESRPLRHNQTLHNPAPQSPARTDDPACDRSRDGAPPGALAENSQAKEPPRPGQSSAGSAPGPTPGARLRSRAPLALNAVGQRQEPGRGIVQWEGSRRLAGRGRRLARRQRGDRRRTSGRS